MPNPERDISSLWDMHQALEQIQEFTANLSYDDYLASRLVQSAVERQLEILGEAARRISDGFRAAHPDIRLAQDYWPSQYSEPSL